MTICSPSRGTRRWNCIQVQNGLLHPAGQVWRSFDSDTEKCQASQVWLLVILPTHETHLFLTLWTADLGNNSQPFKGTTLKSPFLPQLLFPSLYPWDVGYVEQFDQGTHVPYSESHLYVVWGQTRHEYSFIYTIYNLIQ